MRRLDSLFHDIRFTLRSFRRSPGFFGVAVLVLAVGIGMSTAIITVLHTVALRDLPVPDQNALVRLYAEDLSRGFDHVPLTHGMFEEFARTTNAFTSVGALRYEGAWPRDFRDGDRHVRATGAVVAGEFFQTLGRAAALGRTLNAADYDEGAEIVMVISDAMWRREYGADPAAIGRRLRLVFSNAVDLTIVGVMPPMFNLPGGADYWMPLRRLPDSPPGALSSTGVDVIGRLAPGYSGTAAEQELDAYLASQTISESDAYRRVNATAHPLLEAEVGEVRPALFIVSSAAALLLLIACFNIATLFLMRSSRRGHELHVRNALGASRGRLAVQLVTESVVVSALGGIAGFLLVGPTLRMFVAIAPAGLPRIDDIGLNGASLSIGLGITSVVALLSGAVPALNASGPARTSRLQSGQHRTTGGRRSVVARRILVSSQFGLALVVLAAAGLVVRSLDRLQSLDPGFQPGNLVHVELAGPLDKLGPPEPTRDFFERLLPALESRPGIERASAISIGPFAGSGGYDGRYVADGQSPEEAESNPWLNFEVVSPAYFEVFRLAALSGRPLGEQDREGAPKAVVLSESAATALWPGADPVGRQVRTARDGSDWYTVVGIVSDTRYREYRDPRPSIYFTTDQSPYAIHPSQLAVRTSGSDAAAIATIRQVVAETEPEILVAVVSPMTELMESPLAQPRLNVLLLTAFAATALVLAAVGLYGILAFAVRQRRRELGIRQALGASATDVARVVLREGMIVALAGTAVGLLLSLTLGRMLQTVLYDVSPADPLTLTAVCGFLTVVAFGACLLPARQAARTDPSELLRTE